MQALLSVYDKSGLEKFARGLIDLHWDLLSTGGTLGFLENAGVPVQSVESLTGFPEMMDGRVKTLHPAIHGGILARRSVATDLDRLDELGFGPIDMVVGNLYPFEETIHRADCDLETALENIDIGGPAMIRAAAKNFPDVLVCCQPEMYEEILAALQAGEVSQEIRRGLAARAFGHVSRYDSVVAGYLTDPGSFPESITVAGDKALDLRYGENPHQTAAAYKIVSATHPAPGVLSGTILQGKELSYNNVLDADAAWNLCRRLPGTACVIVKHAIPCGASTASTPPEAFASALAGDPVSAYGGIVAINTQIDQAVAFEISKVFFEVIIAPEFTPAAREQFAKQPNLRLLELRPEFWRAVPNRAVRSITGGLLVQDADVMPDDGDWAVVTETVPSDEHLADLRFAWEVVRSVRSNAIVLVRNQSIVGVGPGQPNRVDCVRIALERAGGNARGSVLASDAFFPFPDGVEAAIEGGVAAIVQPGGSIRDTKTIAVANAARIPMLFTGYRHFTH